MSDRIRMIIIIVLMVALGLMAAVVGITTTIDADAAPAATSRPSQPGIRLVTANIGRRDTPDARAAAIRRVPLGITGWQEIDADDRGDEHAMIARARPAHSWACPRTQVPVTIPPALVLVGDRVRVLSRAVRPRISARRVLCEARIRTPGGDRLAVLNAHLIAKAYSGGRRPRAKGLRVRLWERSWRRIHERADWYAARGWAVYVLGDLNRSRLPRPLPAGRVLAGHHNDYIIGTGRVMDRAAVRLRIDGHRAHRVVLHP